VGLPVVALRVTVGSVFCNIGVTFDVLLEEDGADCAGGGGFVVPGGMNELSGAMTLRAYHV